MQGDRSMNEYSMDTGTYCAVLGCSNCTYKRNKWKESFCAEDKQLKKDCQCLEPFPLYRFPKGRPEKLLRLAAINRPKISQSSCTRILSECSFLLFLTVFLVCTSAHQLPPIQSSNGGSLPFTYQGFRSHLNINLGIGIEIQIENCDFPSINKRCFKTVGGETKLQIENVVTGVETVGCHEVIWHNPDSRQEDCISLGNALWYGGAEMLYQHWPIQNMSLDRVPYITGDFAHNPLGGIMDNIWFNSDGYSLFVDRNTPLFIRFNRTGDGQFCLSSSYDEYPFTGASQTRRQNKELKYIFCSADNIRESFQFAIGRWIDIPLGVVDPELIARPIWSTWARYPREINAQVVTDFAKEIVANGFKASHFEIDDMWETCYGELQFDSQKFPNISATVQEIKDHGFKVSLWVHPYLNTDCPSFNDSQVRKYLIMNDTSKEPLECTWWNGVGGYLDTTNQKATDHFISKLTSIKEVSGIDTFKFDSGEVEYISEDFILSDSDVMATPNNFTRLYVNTAARMGNGVEVRVAYNSQKLPIFVRMLDKDSRWDFTNGLQTLIPTALHMSIIGFPYILPDMIGGNNYNSTDLPDKDLFIRWLQVNVFMPALQFSIVPWDYQDLEVVGISKAMIKLHEQYAPLINQLADEASRTGNPIVRPLWWIAPTDKDALEAEQQYLLGNDILVAPIVEEGANVRDIYIPEGKWDDHITEGTSHTGPVWLRNYVAELYELPYFTRVK